MNVCRITVGSCKSFTGVNCCKNVDAINALRNILTRPKSSQAILKWLTLVGDEHFSASHICSQFPADPDASILSLMKCISQKLSNKMCIGWIFEFFARHFIKAKFLADFSNVSHVMDNVCQTIEFEKFQIQKYFKLFLMYITYVYLLFYTIALACHFTFR